MPKYFSETDLELYVNPAGLNAIQTYANAAMILMLGLFLMLLVGLVLFFVAFYPPTFGVGGKISYNTQVVVGFIACLVEIAGILVIVGAARQFERAKGLYAQACVDDEADYKKWTQLGVIAPMAGNYDCSWYPYRAMYYKPGMLIVNQGLVPTSEIPGAGGGPGLAVGAGPRP